MDHHERGQEAGGVGRRLQGLLTQLQAIERKAGRSPHRRDSRYTTWWLWKELSKRGVKGGKSLRTVQRVLDGTAEPKAGFVEAVSALLGVRVEWLMTGEGMRSDGAAAMLAKSDQALRGTLTKLHHADDVEAVYGVDLGARVQAEPRRRAVLRLADRLRSARVRYADPHFGRRNLLKAAALFLLAAERGLDSAVTLEKRHPLPDATLYSDETGFVRPFDQSAAEYDAFADEVLGLFARRIVGFTETPTKEKRRVR